MHVRDNRAFRLGQLALEKMRGCRLFAAEIDLEDSSGLISFPTFPWKSALGEKKFAKLQKTVWRFAGIPPEQLVFLSPIFVQNLLAERFLSQEAPLALDSWLWEQAREMGLERTGLETFESQKQVLLAISPRQQLRMLLGSVRNLSAYRKQINHLTNLYEKGDLPGLYRISRKSAGGFRKSLLFQRNLVMADRIEYFCRQQTLFAAVGAAHLPGAKGVLRLLKKKGFQIHPIIS